MNGRGARDIQTQSILQTEQMESDGAAENVTTAASLTRYTKGDPLPEGVQGAPNEEKLVLLMEKTGFMISQTNGQRRFGPPPDWSKEAPPRGCEVFIGKLPRDLYEDELVPVLQTVGALYEVRLMMDFSGNNRGYAFAVYGNRDDAKRCVRMLNNYEIRKGRTIGVCISVDNCRLFIGGIPKRISKEAIFAEMRKMTDSVADVIVYPSAVDKTKNRGFAFVEYENHRAAAVARRRLMSQRLVLWGHQIAVDWAEPEQEVDEEIMAKVKVLYVRNLMLTTTDELILSIFVEYAPVEKVKKIRDYAFVHFSSREDAVKAKDATDGIEIDGSIVSVSWAKPVDRELHRMARNLGRNLYQAGAAANAYTHEMGVAPQASHMYEYASFSSPYRGRSHLGVTSDVNRIPSSVLASQGAGGNGGGGNGGGGGSGGGGGGGGTPNCMPSPVTPTATAFIPPPPASYGASPIMIQHFYPDPATVAPAPPALVLKKQAAKALEDVCTKNNWGSPVYTLNTFDCRVGMKLYAHKVCIPALGRQFQSTKLCSNPDDAKIIAAENVILQLGIPILTDGFALANVQSHLASIPNSLNSPKLAAGMWQHVASSHEAIYQSGLNGFQANQPVYIPQEVYSSQF
eukprot:m.70368 g.70368  ORF g.70368 m.70368 type:complete len:627 (+) comp35689_c0_seq5:382-2262(+)